MKRTLMALTLSLGITGCASTDFRIPSFWDDNQSMLAAQIRLDVERIDCSQPQLPQAQALNDRIRLFQLYSESKGRLQKDVLAVIGPMDKTVKDWADRAAKTEPSRAYCDIKKRVLTSQSKLTAEAVLGRY